VLFADYLGIVVVMPRAEPADPSAIDAAIERDSNFEPHITTEFMPAVYGILNGKVVCVDYGLADADMVRE
jgi:hypothetical protein